ncbi:MmRce1 family CPBP family CAAX prenyl protease [Methanogenium organophilum]|uniref:Type II CAAX endopeptidase family protein n=1 Tax=Methanogenium organophilum TaxID=2199 RepID=A0A9X9S3H1_METOG|nr:MmRce1 family CPBP family CAAX prenyl protease [Methanogenium organophilum]WAI01098.1 type II CAAX endopeptidase family protein [Methanogenium organophilum]
MISNYKYKPLVYFAAVFIVTYVLWFAGAYVSFQDDISGLYMLLMLPGLMAPFLLSLVFIFGSKNSGLIKDFVNRLFNLRLIEPKMLPVFFLIMPFSVVVSILLSLPFGGAVSQFQLSEGFSFSSGFVPVLVLLLLAASFEELGWRGYAFDSLQSRHTIFRASVIFGILWSLWHFPLIFVNNSYQYEIFHESIWYAVNFFAGFIAIGIIISWICIKNGKSIPAAILFHFIVNMSQETLMITQTTKCIQTVVLLIFAGVIVALDKEMFFSRNHLVVEGN